MTQEDLDALNDFIAKYPICEYTIRKNKHGFRFAIYAPKIGAVDMYPERRETLSEAIADVVAQMEAAGVA